MKSILHQEREYVICVMPNSSCGYNSSGLRDVAKNLCSPPIIDGTRVLERITALPPKHLGGPRNYQLERDSLHVSNPIIVKDRIVLLLDDVTTSGKSLQAGADVLVEAHAAGCVPFALGKTYRSNNHGE